MGRCGVLGCGGGLRGALKGVPKRVYLGVRGGLQRPEITNPKYQVPCIRARARVKKKTTLLEGVLDHITVQKGLFIDRPRRASQGIGHLDPKMDLSWFRPSFLLPFGVPHIGAF